MSSREDVLEYHSEKKGKIKVVGKTRLETDRDLELAYTPGVAEPVKEISENPENVYKYTSKGELVAIVSDGSSVLGMGESGPEASIPVMEGKSLLMCKMADLSGFPLILDETKTDEIISTVERLHPMFGFIMLEDIASPKCFRVEDELKDRLEIPVFHDDQHGAAVASLAALNNALDLVEKSLKDVEIVVIGAGAAGIGTAQLLLDAGAEDIKVVDLPGIISPDMDELNWKQKEIAELTNPEGMEGSLEDALEGADVMIGLATGGIVSKKMVESMAEDPIVFALANPDPEIHPEKAKDAGAKVVATGRSDFPNQVNNSIVFPGIAQGSLNCFAKDINTEMKLKAAERIADMVEDPRPEKVIPSSLDKEVVEEVAEAVMEGAHETGVCRIH
ncbi:MAG: malic enzyme-like NAD(P)-binding protein [Candidatus Nanohaloarchaea archaeon]|nr:malic enzyme-like NAD(P)-binding protein [Candidatus Nanohaloarchaea archaeon]